MDCFFLVSIINIEQHLTGAFVYLFIAPGGK